MNMTDAYHNLKLYHHIMFANSKLYLYFPVILAYIGTLTILSPFSAYHNNRVYQSSHSCRRPNSSLIKHKRSPYAKHSSRQRSVGSLLNTSAPKKHAICSIMLEKLFFSRVASSSLRAPQPSVLA